MIAPLPRVVHTPALIPLPPPLPRKDLPVLAIYSFFTLNSGQRRRKNKNIRPDFGRATFPSTNSIQPDLISIVDDIEDSSITTHTVPLHISNIDPSLLPITTVQHTTVTSLFHFS